MFSLSRRQARAALVGTAAAATYLFGSEVARTRPVRGTALFTVASLGLAAAMSGIVNSKGSAKAYAAHARLDNFFNNGGSVGGDFTVQGNHMVAGQVRGVSGGAMNADQGVFVGGGNLGVNNAIHMNGNNINNVGHIGPWNGNGASHVNHASGTIGSVQGQLNNLLDALNGVGLMN